MIDSSSLPALRAELVAECAESVVAPVERLSGGRWAVRDDARRQLLLLDGGLRVLERFPIPDGIGASGDTVGGYHFDIGADGRFAVFAGPRQTVCVRPDGHVAWQTEHPVLIDGDGEETLPSAVFAAGGRELWAFVPVPDQECFADDETVTTERWVVTPADPAVVHRSTALHTGTFRVLIHPDGHRASASMFDGHDLKSWWTEWDDDGGGMTVSASGTGHPLDVRPDGTSWIENSYGHLVLRRFDDETGEGGPYSQDNAYRWAYFLGPESVLAISEQRLPGEWPARVEGLLLDLENLAPYARLGYPDGPEGEPTEPPQVVSCAGDGTWLTLTGTDEEPARLRRWRLAR